MNSTRDKKDHRDSILALTATFLFAALTVAVLLTFGLYRTFPPPPEYGMEVNLGYMDEGDGDLQAFDPSTGSVEPQEASVVEPETEEVVSTADEEAPAIVKKDKEPERKKPTQAMTEKPREKVEEAKPEEPVINPMALYPGKRKGGEASAQGDTGKPGDKGNPAGDVNGQGYAGSGGSGGISFSLNGRTLMSLVKPDYDSEEEGVVVVRIWVNRNGAVTRVSAGVKGTTTLDENLWKTAERAAMRSKFVPKENAPEEQIGTITYRFVRGS